MHEDGRKVVVLKEIGFCSGVRRAVRAAEAALRKENSAYVLDEILHNEEEMKRLKKMGLKRAGADTKGEVIMIPAHGASADELRDIKNRFHNVLDLTCPFVLRTMKIIEELRKEGYKIAVAGDSGHRETTVLAKTCGESLFGVFETSRDVKGKLARKIGLVCQSTINRERFFEIAEAFVRIAPEVRIFNTICNETVKRQEDARKLASKVDLVIVIGGKKSANSKRLFEEVVKVNQNAIFVSSAEELARHDISSAKRIGVVSGTSTPDWLIESVVNVIKGGTK